MSLLKHLSTSLSKASQQPQFHVPHFKKVINALLTCPPSERGGKKRSTQGELDAEVRDQFVVKWLNVYTDVRWFFLRDAEYDFLVSVLCPQFTKIVVQASAFIFFTQDERPCPRKPSFLPREAGVISSCTDRTEIFLGGRVASQACQVEKRTATDSELDDSGTDNESDSTKDDWRKFFDEVEKPQKNPSEPSMRLHQMTVHQSLHSLASHRAVFTRLWLRLLPRLSDNERSGSALSLRVLNVLHRGVLPHLTRAVMVMDWVGRCVDYGKFFNCL